MARSPRDGDKTVVEKPVVATSAEADRLINLAKECKKVLTVFHSKQLRRGNTARDVASRHCIDSLLLTNDPWETDKERRYDSDFRTLRHLTAMGALDDVKDAQIHF